MCEGCVGACTGFQISGFRRFICFVSPWTIGGTCEVKGATSYINVLKARPLARSCLLTSFSPDQTPTTPVVLGVSSEEGRSRNLAHGGCFFPCDLHGGYFAFSVTATPFVDRASVPRCLPTSMLFSSERRFPRSRPPRHRSPPTCSTPHDEHRAAAEALWTLNIDENDDFMTPCKHGIVSTCCCW